MEIIGIAGGSGSGKSTVSYLLVDSNPKRFEVIHLDDYQMIDEPDRVPEIAGMKNWEHPDAVNWDRLKKDLDMLRSGHEVETSTWSDRSNPDFPKTGQLKPRRIIPRPVMILEGYVALHDSIIDQLDRSFYLDLDNDTRLERRRQARQWEDEPDDIDYDTVVQLPMHAQFVEPTKANADVIINVKDKSPAEVGRVILEHVGLRPE